MKSSLCSILPRQFLLVVCLLAWFISPAYAQRTDSLVVHKLEIKGNRALGGRGLKLLMYTRKTPWYDFLPGVGPQYFNRRVFELDLERIRSRYRELGYFDAQVDTTIERGTGTIRIGIRIQENDAVRVQRRLIADVPDALKPDTSAMHKGLKIRVGSPMERQILETDRNILRRFLEDQGYAFTSVRVQVERTGTSAVVGYHLEPGPPCEIASVRVEGNTKVGEGTIRRGITVRPGQAYRKSQLLDSQRQLYRSGAFRSVTLATPDSAVHRSPVDVVVSVRERAPRVVKLGGGYSHPEEKVRGQFVWQHRNFMGGARQLTLESEASAIWVSGTVSLRQPYILGSKTWLTTSTFIEQDRREGTEVKRLGGSATLERTFGPATRVFFQVRTELVDFSPDSTRTNFIVGYQKDTRDDFFNPSRGTYTSLTVEESGLFFRSHQEILKFAGEGRWYHRIPFRNVLAFRIKGGLIQEVGRGREVPNFERFFSGGANSVRGWPLNLLAPRDADGNVSGGLSLFEAGVELRTTLHSMVGTALFLDAGNVGSHQSDAIELTSLKFAAGFGLRYLSPIGPIRFDVARRLSADAFVADRVQIYLSLGQAF